MQEKIAIQLGHELGKHLSEVYTGGNWTSVNLEAQISGLPWTLAIQDIRGCNSIAVLTCHMTYYIDALVGVLQGGTLKAKDALSFAVPTIQCQEDWDSLVRRILQQAALAASLLQAMPNERFAEPFAEEKYGHWFRNVWGMVEHLHYHLGQVVLLKKLLQNGQLV